MQFPSSDSSRQFEVWSHLCSIWMHWPSLQVNLPWGQVVSLTCLILQRNLWSHPHFSSHLDLPSSWHLSSLTPEKSTLCTPEQQKNSYQVFINKAPAENNYTEQRFETKRQNRQKFGTSPRSWDSWNRSHQSQLNSNFLPSQAPTNHPSVLVDISIYSYLKEQKCRCIQTASISVMISFLCLLFN